MNLPKKGPWSDRWIDPKVFREGGQGATFKVTDISDGSLGVLKVLKNNRSQPARGRMNIEANSLEALYKSGGRVPKVYESNKEAFSDKIEKHLYIVMEYVEGQSLTEFINKNHPIEIEKAITIVQDIAFTIRIAHSIRITHRDIKPDNLIVSKTDPLEITVLDFGLSFNANEPLGVTQTSEGFRNEFLNLPEFNIAGAEKHDARSDITLLCGILYFCLTNHYPKLLAREKGKLVHRISGFKLEENRPKEPALDGLSTFFDRGFIPSMDARYQNLDQCFEKLKVAISPDLESADISPMQLESEIADEFLAVDRTTRLQAFARKHEATMKYLALQAQGESQGFRSMRTSISRVAIPKEAVEGKEEFDCVPAPGVRIFTEYPLHPSAACGVFYILLASVDSCFIFRSQLYIGHRHTIGVADQWEVVAEFEGLSAIEAHTKQLLEADVRRAIKAQLRQVRKAITGLHEAT